VFETAGDEDVDVDEDGGVSGRDMVGSCGSDASSLRQERTKNEESESRMHPASAMVASGTFARVRYVEMRAGEVRFRDAACGIRFASWVAATRKRTDQR
jgi:hypothetical protein